MTRRIGILKKYLLFDILLSRKREQEYVGQNVTVQCGLNYMFMSHANVGRS